MTFRQMELFISICEAESINKAAVTNFISQQGLSKMIQELEQELDCQLLVRSKQGIKPTGCGLYFLNECKQILEKKEHLTTHINNIKDIPQEVINIGMAFGMISVIHYKTFLDFQVQYPHIRIDYTDQTDIYLEHLYQRGQFDFCVVTGTIDHDSFKSELIYRSPIFLSVPKSHPLYNKKSISMDMLAEYDFAIPTTQFFIRHNFELSFAKFDIKPNISISSNDFNSLKEVSKENNLLFVLPEHTINKDDKGVKYFPFPDTEFTWDIYFIKRKNASLSENTQIFYNYLKNHMLSF